MLRLQTINLHSITRNSLAVLLSLMLASPLWAAPSTVFGTVVFANRARVGASNVTVGATVFGGDRISTDDVGSVQIRAGAARLVLSNGGSATLIQDATPAATVASGTAMFSTANSKALALHVASALVRPSTDKPTVGKVTILTPKEFTVQCTLGALTVAVEDDVREIPEGAAYRVVLDPNAPAPQGPRGAGTKGMGGPPIKPARSRFIWYAIGITAGVAAYATSEALESPVKP